METVTRSTEGSPEQPRRRRRRLLTQEAILDAALAVIDETGELTMAVLAARLGSTASSIYHHFRNRMAIIEALRERVGATIDLPAEAAAWDDALPGFLRSYRDAFARRPRLIPLLTAQTISGDSTVAVYDRLARLLGRSGFPPAEHLLWLSVLDNYVLGSALDLAAPDQIWQSRGTGTPALDAAVLAAPTGRERADASFALGLRALIEGMRAHLLQVSAQPSRNSRG